MLIDGLRRRRSAAAFGLQRRRAQQILHGRRALQLRRYQGQAAHRAQMQFELGMRTGFDGIVAGIVHPR